MPTPENEARVEIDSKLTAAGWIVQDRGFVNLGAGLGIAVREFSLKPGHGTADYLLYFDAEAIGVIEAKPSGVTLTSAEAQARRYSEGLPDDLNAHHRPLPFVYQASGTEIHFTNFLEENPRARDVFHFHTPEGLLELSNQGHRQLRTLVRDMPAIADGIAYEGPPRHANLRGWPKHDDPVLQKSQRKVIATKIADKAKFLAKS